MTKEGEIADALAGQNCTESQVAEKYGVSIEEVEDVMIDAGYERCQACDHWVEAGETLDDNGEPTFLCLSCRDAVES